MCPSSAWRSARFLSTLSLRRATESIETLRTVSVRFLSTLSLRRATPPYSLMIHRTKNFYPRSPCGERRLNLPSRPIDKNISIHALLAESDEREYKHRANLQHFYPRSPCGERRCEMISIERCSLISIHALLAESDNDVF